MTHRWRNVFSAIVVVVLSLLSVIVVIDNAGAEPYVTFRHSDAMVQIGGAFVLLVLWFQYAIWLAVEIAHKRISSWWLAVLLWAAIVCPYIYHCPFGYVGDITKFVVERH
jgi:uncharacterized membrane protein YhaH (DUF805 family)